ncbi:MAG TPA: thioredoxin domain-containing protein [Pyrinomonadaceae bacterium]|jgi:protein-disulfide isomerase|nr:thioredoxin domain-containing protein [Pyrinomonadaceae bacterium]
MRWTIACVTLVLAAFLAACGGSGNGNAVKNGNSNTVKKDGNTIPPNSPPGAQPPNQTGSAAASVTLEEFADFQCPQCAAKHPVMNEIKSMYGSRIHFIFRDYPLDIPAHDKSYEAAVAADAAGMQNKFWEMQNLLFTNQKAWTSDPNYKQVWKEYGTRIGLDVDKWENDMLGIASKARVDADKKRGQAIGVNSTPTLYINNVAIPFEQMTVEGLKQAIDAELAKAAPATQAAPANTTNSNK